MAPTVQERAGQLIDRYFTAPCDPLELHAPSLLWPDYAVAAALLQRRAAAIGPTLQFTLDGPLLPGTLTWDHPTPPPGLAAAAPLGAGVSRLLEIPNAASATQIQKVDGEALLRAVPNLPKSEVELFVTMLEWGVPALLASYTPVTFAWSRVGTAFSIAAGIPELSANPAAFARLLQYWFQYTTQYVAARPYIISGPDRTLYDDQNRNSSYALRNSALTLLAVTI